MPRTTLLWKCIIPFSRVTQTHLGSLNNCHVNNNWWPASQLEYSGHCGIDLTDKIKTPTFRTIFVTDSAHKILCVFVTSNVPKNTVKFRRNRWKEKSNWPILIVVQCVTTHSKSKSDKTEKTKTSWADTSQKWWLQHSITREEGRYFLTVFQSSKKCLKVVKNQKFD